MHLNHDFARAVLLHTERLDWQPSPMPGVARRMLDRMGDEVARATSIVRYDPGSSFSAHTHGGGEEFLVLEGVFQDEHGDFPAGSYLRNPPGSRHTPRSAPGCVIFVKLWQFASNDSEQVRTALPAQDQQAVEGRPGIRATQLFSDQREDVRSETWPAGHSIELCAQGGLELLVLRGSGEVTLPLGEQAPLERHSWLRLPVGAALRARAGEEGCRVWMKTGHLRFVGAPPAETST